MSRKRRDFLELDQVLAIERIADCVCEIRHDITRIAHAVEKLASIDTVTDFTLHQIIEGESMAINGTVVGTTSTFNIGFVPATNFIPLVSGPSVSVDDTTVVLTQPDASNNFTAAVPAGDTGASYNLTITGVNDQNVTVTHAFNIPILPTPPPPPTSVTDFSLNQLS